MTTGQLGVLVTGASGFVGRRIWHVLRQDPRLRVWAGLRTPEVASTLGMPAGDCRRVVLGESPTNVDLSGVDVIVHAAAQVPASGPARGEVARIMRAVNTAGTLALAGQAAAAGVRRFVFLSSVKVNGETTRPGQAFSPDDVPAPADDYGLSKWEAEQGLLALAGRTGIEVVIVRAPLVYGPGVKGNVASMMAWVRKGVPLPLGAVRNRRSLLALDNLVSFIALCADPDASPRAANQVFLLSDGEDVSIAELLHKVANAQGRQARLFAAPVAWLRWGARLAGRPGIADRLLESLVVDSTKARTLLGWQPVVTLEQQLKTMVEHAASV